jgi:hypothetical protein
LGAFALPTKNRGNYNTAIGFRADIAADAGHVENSTALGNQAKLHASNSIVLGNGKIAKIYAQVTAISSISDRRRKKDIRALDAGLGLDFIEKLKPVSYRFDNGDDTERYGFIAQDVEQALPVWLHDMIERAEPEHGLALIERQNDENRSPVTARTSHRVSVVTFREFPVAQPERKEPTQHLGAMLVFVSAGGVTNQRCK